MLTDFHLHTTVSDGELDPRALLARAKGHGITHLSVTDHDALGAYAWSGGAIFAEARRLGLSPTGGIERAADLDGLEVHVLGFDLAGDHPALRAHLEAVRAARAERARREIGIVNALLGEGTIAEATIFVPGRETLMKPHFIHPILEKGHFATYEEANAWYRKNVKAGVAGAQPAISRGLQPLHRARGGAAPPPPGRRRKALPQVGAPR